MYLTKENPISMRKLKKFLFIGYDSKSKGYKLYDPNTKKVISSWDVEFNEEDSWRCDTQEKERDFLPIIEKEEEQARIARAYKFTSFITSKPPWTLSNLRLKLNHSAKETIDKELTRTIWGNGKSKWTNSFCLLVICKPTGFEEVVKNSKWLEAMDEVIIAILKYVGTINTSKG